MKGQVSDPVIRMENASKSFYLGDNEIRALKNVNLDIFPGQSLAIMGRSGSGKSTLLHTLGLLTPLDQGRIFLRGKSVSRSDMRDKSIRRNFGFIFQDAKLIPDLNVIDNVCLPLVHRGFWPHKQRALALAVLEKVDLTNRIDHSPQQLSGGEIMRVAIARALILNPLILLADEPTGSLDSTTSDIIMNLLLGTVTAQRALVIVTHYEPLAKSADRTASMKDGFLDSGDH